MGITDVTTVDALFVGDSTAMKLQLVVLNLIFDSVQTGLMNSRSLNLRPTRPSR